MGVSFKRIFIDIVLLPVFCMAYVIMQLHRFNPGVWRFCVRPAVCRMREVRHYSYVLPARIHSDGTCFCRPLVSFFNNEFRTLIRLIRLESADSGLCGEGAGLKADICETMRSVIALRKLHSFFVPACGQTSGGLEDIAGARQEG